MKSRSNHLPTFHNQSINLKKLLPDSALVQKTNPTSTAHYSPASTVSDLSLEKTDNS